jgi:hypothetical protein
MAAVEFFVATNGNDRWSGLLAEPNESQTDGPFATVGKARDAVLELKRTGLIREPAAIWVRGGRYTLTEPIRFGPGDDFPVTVGAYGDEEPVFSGAVPLSGWEETTFNGVKAWCCDVSVHLARRGSFRSLYVNGEPRPRARFPKEGFLQVRAVPGVSERFDLYGNATSYFDFADGDIGDWASVCQGEVVVKHLWIEERLPIERVDRERRRFHFERSSIFVLSSAHGPEGADYWIENVPETCTAPGEWVLAEQEEKLYYIPKEDETLDACEIRVPVVRQFVRFQGEPETGNLVRHIHLEGLQFECADWVQAGEWDEVFEPHAPLDEPRYDPSYRVPGSTPDPARGRASVPQAAAYLPGAISFLGAENCSLENCAVRNCGFYAVNIGLGCRAIRVVGNELSGLGAGGVKVSGGDHTMPQHLRTGCNLIADNHIYDGGRIFLSAVGVALLQTFENQVIHNHIHDLYYSGVSCGWIWGYTESVARDNLIAYNHIHDLGKGYISDMGAVYMLGVQPGTVIRGNLIHTVESQRYGGWGIYLDEGSSHMIVEDNVVHHTQCAGFNQHFGRENTVRNNIFAFCGEGHVSLSATEGHVSLNLQHNIILCDGQSPFFAGYAANDAARAIRSDLNCIWDVSGSLAEAEGAMLANREKALASRRQWLEAGLDVHSLFEDPGFADAADGQFDLPDDSPAFALGFRRIDLSGIGPRAVGNRSFDLGRLNRRYRLYRDMEKGVW